MLKKTTSRAGHAGKTSAGSWSQRGQATPKISKGRTPDEQASIDADNKALAASQQKRAKEEAALRRAALKQMSKANNALLPHAFVSLFDK
eukprot:519509-Rhodomonas_salina.1